MGNGDIIVIQSNGNTAINRQDGKWVSTNNKGKRKAKRIADNVEFELESIPAALDGDDKTKSILPKITLKNFTLLISFDTKTRR